jgi:hypothetical protein
MQNFVTLVVIPAFLAGVTSYFTTPLAITVAEKF